MENEENLNNSITKTDEMTDKRAKQRKKVISAFGFGIFIFGLYLILAYLGIIPFSSRFSNFLNTKSQILISGVVCLVVGGVMNGAIRKTIKAIFQK